MPVVNPSEGAGRIKELDSLRGMLAVGVLAFHVYPQALFWFWSCVDGFLVISGFVITRLLLANQLNRATFVSFYARRILRIWPVYYLSLATALLMNWLYFTKNGLPLDSIRGIPQSLIFLQFAQFYWTPYSEYFPYNYIWWFLHSWSLAVEDQFYWLWPVAILLLRRKSAALIGFCFIAVAVGVWTRYSGHLIFLLTTRIDGLAFGALLAIAEPHAMSQLRNKPAARLIMVSACAAVCCACAAALCWIYILPNYALPRVQSLHYQNTTWLVTLFAACYAALVGLLWLYRDHVFLGILRSRALLWLGARSYAIYMFHPLVQAAVERVFERIGSPKMGIAAVTLAITLFLSDLSCRYFEALFATARRRFPLKPVAGLSS